VLDSVLGGIKGGFLSKKLTLKKALGSDAASKGVENRFQQSCLSVQDVLLQAALLYLGYSTRSKVTAEMCHCVEKRSGGGSKAVCRAA